MRTVIGSFLLAIAILRLTSSIDASPADANLLIQWDNATLQGIRDAKLGAPMVARALAVTHTCMYDAWAAYDEHAIGTQMQGALRRPIAERIEANKEKAISYAAFRALSDVLPVDTNSVYIPLMKRLGYDPNDNSTDIETPSGIGNVACAAVLEYRHHDKSNQLGDLATGVYNDWTGYASVNKPTGLPAQTKMSDPNHWQPLIYVNAYGDLVSQKFMAAQWCYVQPFALSKGEEFRGLADTEGPAKYGSPEYEAQAKELVDFSSGLTDKDKAIVEYWMDGPNTEQPPGHWALFAQYVSARDHHTLDDDVKMFFALTNAVFDAGIAAWDMKRSFDSVRPATAIPFLYNGKQIQAWGGPGRGTVEMDGAQWIPYQPKTFPTPPFPDYVSGHSTYSAAAAAILADWTGTDHFGYSTTIAKGSSRIEPGITPARPVVLSWSTFTEAANQAGLSRRLGGIHFRRADLVGRQLGRMVAAKTWAKAQDYFNGTLASPTQSMARSAASFPVRTQSGTPIP
jgi:hypothetical protein